MEIEKLSKSEIPALVKLMQEVVPEIEYYPKPALKEFLKEYTPDFFEKLLKQNGSIALVSKENNEITGFAFGWNDYGVYWLDWIGIKKEFRGRGIATGLLKEFENECKRKGGHKVHLDTSQTNKPAINLYLKNGYFIEGYLNKHWLKWNYVLLSKFFGDEK
jgi:ribosomal protein S18 acetylase RimI-like enzyme